jgi:hypothetical protein
LRKGYGSIELKVVWTWERAHVVTMVDIFGTPPEDVCLHVRGQRGKAMKNKTKYI